MPEPDQTRFEPGVDQDSIPTKTQLRVEFPGDMKDDDLYELKYLDEVVKLRWLITRQPAALELRYYLLFMLVTHARYSKAVEECRRILAGHPQDTIARFWLTKLKEWGCEEPSTRDDQQLGLSR